MLFLLDYFEGMCPAVHPFVGIPQQQTSRSSPVCIYQLSEEEVEEPLTVIFFRRCTIGNFNKMPFSVPLCV